MVKKISPDREQVILTAYQAGQTGDEAAGLARCSKATAYNVLRRHGLSPRGIAESHRTYQINHHFFSVIDSEAKAYVLGFVSADGCVMENRLTVSLAARDLAHIEKLRVAMGGTHPIAIARRGAKATARLSIRSQQLTDDLRRLGVTERKSFTLRPAKAPSDLERHYWRGMVDGNGTISKIKPSGRKKHPTWNVGIHAGGHWVPDCFADFLGRAINYKPSVKKCKGGFRVQVNGVELPQLIVGLLYNGSSIHLDRKKARADELLAATSIKPNRIGAPITYHGQTRRLFEWSAITGLKSSTIAARIKSGWPVEQALTKGI